MQHSAILGELHVTVQNRHGLPLLDAMMSDGTSFHGGQMQVAATRSRRDEEASPIRLASPSNIEPSSPRIVFDSRQELAVLNNVYWYLAMFRAHQLACSGDDLAWSSEDSPPAFHSNLVTLSPAVDMQRVRERLAPLERTLSSAGFAMKDSFANLDLADSGYEVLFEATWIWHEPLNDHAPGASGNWTVMTCPDQLAVWEEAWWATSADKHWMWRWLLASFQPALCAFGSVHPSQCANRRQEKPDPCDSRRSLCAGQEENRSRGTLSDWTSRATSVCRRPPA